MKNYTDSPAQYIQQEKTAQQLTESEISKNIILHHISSFLDNDLETLLSDYTTDSLLITQDKMYTGPEEIKSFFINLVKYFPKQQSSFTLDKVVADDNLVFIAWHAITPTVNVPLGSDTFIIRDSKINRQTFAGQLNFLT